MSKRKSIESFGPPPLPKPPEDHFWRVEQNTRDRLHLVVTLKKKMKRYAPGHLIDLDIVYPSRLKSTENQIVKAAEKMLARFYQKPPVTGLEHLEGEYE